MTAPTSTSAGEFYGEAAAPALGDPALDPPMTVRVHPDDDPRSTSARRVIRVTWTGTPMWMQTTGYPMTSSGLMRNHHVANWPVQHPVVYATTYRHETHARARNRLPVAMLDGADAEGAAPFKDARPVAIGETG